jgi:hypothetical protein
MAFTDTQGVTKEDEKAARRKERSNMQAPIEERKKLAQEDKEMDAVAAVSVSPSAAELRNISRRLKEAANNMDPDFDMAGEVAKVAKMLKGHDDEGLSQAGQTLEGHVKKGRKVLAARKKAAQESEADADNFDFESAIARVAQRLEQMSNEALAAQQAAAMARPATTRVKEYGTTDPV